MFTPVVRGKRSIRPVGRSVRSSLAEMAELYEPLGKALKDFEEMKKKHQKEHEDALAALKTEGENIRLQATKIQKGDKGDMPIAGVHFRMPKDGKDADEKAIEDRVSKRMVQQMRQPANGKDAIVDYKKLARMVARRMPKPKTSDVDFKAPTTAELVHTLKNLPKGERLTLDDLDGAEDKIKKFWERYPRGYLHGGGDSVAAGSGISITTNGAGQKVISAAGTAISIITVSGTINDSNVDFTANAEPTLLNINGSFYAQTGGNITWTYSGGDIVLSTPVGANGSIFGI